MKIRQNVTRTLLVILGTISVGVGVIGIFVPVLPTTPFLLLAAACYMRSSRRFYNWLTGNRLIGPYVKNYMEGRGMTPKTKAVAITLLWLTIGLTVVFAVHGLTARIVLLVIAVAVTIHVAAIRRKKVKARPAKNGETGQVES